MLLVHFSKYIWNFVNNIASVKEIALHIFSYFGDTSLTEIYRAVSSVQFPVFSVQCSVSSVQCPVSSVQCPVSTVQCPVFILLLTIVNINVLTKIEFSKMFVTFFRVKPFWTSCTCTLHKNLILLHFLKVVDNRTLSNNIVRKMQAISRQRKPCKRARTDLQLLQMNAKKWQWLQPKSLKQDYK